MPNATDLIANIEAHKADLQKALTAKQYKAFEERYYALTDELTGGADPEQVAADLLTLLHDYPPAAALLGVDPAGVAGGEAPAAGVLADEPEEGIPPAELQHQAAESAAIAASVASAAVRPPPSAPIVPIPTQGVTPMSATPPDSQSPAPGLSKAESFILIFKEVVTAIIALLIALTTLLLVLYLVPLLGSADKMTQGKELLSILTGLFGVVLGYYFGRIPADARAAQAQVQAAKAVQQGEQAAAHSDMVSGRAEELADQAKELVIQSQMAPTTRGAGGGPDVSEDLKRWADSVDELRRMSRSR